MISGHDIPWKGACAVWGNVFKLLGFVSYIDEFKEAQFLVEDGSRRKCFGPSHQKASFQGEQGPNKEIIPPYNCKTGKQIILDVFVTFQIWGLGKFWLLWLI